MCVTTITYEPHKNAMDLKAGCMLYVYTSGSIQIKSGTQWGRAPAITSGMILNDEASNGRLIPHGHGYAGL